MRYCKLILLVVLGVLLACVSGSYSVLPNNRTRVGIMVKPTVRYGPTASKKYAYLKMYVFPTSLTSFAVSRDIGGITKAKLKTRTGSPYVFNAGYWGDMVDKKTGKKFRDNVDITIQDGKPVLGRNKKVPGRFVVFGNGAARICRSLYEWRQHPELKEGFGGKTVPPRAGDPTGRTIVVVTETETIFCDLWGTYTQCANSLRAVKIDPDEYLHGDGGSSKSKKARNVSYVYQIPFYTDDANVLKANAKNLTYTYSAP